MKDIQPVPELPAAFLSLVRSEHGDMVKAEFPRHVGHYRNLAYALQDVALFECRPVYSDWQLEAEADVRRMQYGPKWYKSSEYFQTVGA